MATFPYRGLGYSLWWSLTRADAKLMWRIARTSEGPPGEPSLATPTARLTRDTVDEAVDGLQAELRGDIDTLRGFVARVLDSYGAALYWLKLSSM